METEQVNPNHGSRNGRTHENRPILFVLSFFRAFVIVCLPLLVFVSPAFGVIERIYPLKSVLSDAELIFTVKVDALDPDKPSVVFTIDEDLKGKAPFRKMAVNLTGDAEAKKGKQTPQFLKRLAPKLALVIFAVKNGKDYVAFGYSNGTWFQMRGQKGDGEAVRWSFNHFEPYLRRTFKGSTKEMQQAVIDGLSGKKEPPEPDKKEKPGLGPEVKKGESKSEPRKPNARASDFGFQISDSTGGPRTVVTAGPVFAVIPSVLIGGPLAVLAMLFPTVFGGWKRWLAVISVACTVSTLYFVQWLFSGALAGTWWGGPSALWLGMALVTVIGAVWAWRRDLARRLVSGSNPGAPPGKMEFSVLIVLSLVGAGLLIYARVSHQALVGPAWMPVVPFAVGAWAAGLYVAYLRWRDRRQVPVPSSGLQVTGEVGIVATDGLSRSRSAGGTAIMEGPPRQIAAREIGESVRRPPVATEAVMLTAMVFACTVLGAAVQQSVGSQSELFERGDPANNSGEFTLTVGKLVWTFRAPGKGSIASSPLVAGDRVYVGADHKVTSPFGCGAVYCLDAANGDMIWMFNNDGDMKPVSISSPCLAEGRLYIGEGYHDDSGCKVYCLDAAKGTKLWEFETTSHTESSPVVMNGRLYIGAGDDGLYCLDAVRGDKIWHFEGLHIDATPTVVDKRVYCGSIVGVEYQKTQIFCLDAATGDAIWRVDTDLPAAGTPIVDSQHVYFGLGNGRFGDPAEKPAGAILCVRADSGQEVWRRQASNSILASPSADAQSLYFASASGRCYSIDRADHRPRWNDTLAGPIMARPALSRCGCCGAPTTLHVLAGNRTGTALLYCLNAADGRIHWRIDLAAQARMPVELISSPTVIVRPSARGESRRIYFGATLQGAANTGVVYCFEDQLETTAETRRNETP
jgi:outer membrane protein assembly factor BamB